MESTLDVARRAVEADVARDFSSAHRLYLQAATELEAFAAGGTRPPEELAGAFRWRAPQSAL